MSTPRPQADTAGLIDFLWTKFDCHTATREDLEWIGGLNSAVEMMATGLSDTLSSVGCLISADQHEARVSPSGASRLTISLSFSGTRRPRSRPSALSPSSPAKRTSFCANG